jgi:pyruvate/2-oxoglutarate dehydrogenase complex dihydrolipoamide acyltransferase (E2) component
VATKVVMPQAGRLLETGVGGHWLKAEGDQVPDGA